jgi:hypothetical protein
MTAENMQAGRVLLNYVVHYRFPPSLVARVARVHEYMST